MMNKLKYLCNKVEARIVANICTIAGFAAMVAVPFTMYPGWHEEAEMPKSLFDKFR
jgi:hypothetical protein